VSNITLPRAVVEQVREAFTHVVCVYQDEKDMAALAALDAALEAQEDAALLNEPVAMRYDGDGDGYGYLYIDSGSGSDWQRRHKDAEPLYLAPPEPDAKPEPVAHVENGVLVRSALPKGYTGPLYAAPPEPDAKREPATETQVTKAYIAEGTKDWWSDWKAGWRAAERFHGIGKEGGK
jgi:hypothetical protein